MSIKEAFDAVNSNFTELYDTYIIEQISESVRDIEATFSGGTVTSAVEILDPSASTDVNSGALIVNGGTGIAGNLNIGGSATISGNLTIGGNVSVQKVTTASVDTGTITSTLATSDEISARLISIEKITSDASLTIDVDTILEGNLSAAGSVFVGTLDTTDINLTGLINGTTRWFNGNIVMEPGYGINQASRLIGGTIVGSGNSPSTDINSGSLQVRGGAGITGNLNIGGTAKFLSNVSVANFYIPSSSSDSGTPGQLSWDENYFYIYADTQWIRFPKDTGSW
jgi:hypothetical protein